MADWKLRSIAEGPSRTIPNEDIPDAVHLDFFNCASTAHIAFPCNRAGGSGAGSTKEREAAIMPTRWLIRMITDEGLLLPRADRNGVDRRMAVAPPETMGPPLQPRRCQPAGTATTAGCGLRRGGSRGRIKCPSSSQLPPLPKHATATFVNNEASGEEEESMLSERIEDDEVDAMLYCDEEGDALLSASEEGEEEPEVLDVCYCARCFATSGRRNRPVCRPIYTRGHHQSRGLPPRPKRIKASASMFKVQTSNSVSSSVRPLGSQRAVSARVSCSEMW